MPGDYERHQKMLQEIVSKEREAQAKLDEIRNQGNEEIKQAKQEAEQIVEAAKKQAEEEAAEFIDQEISDFRDQFEDDDLEAEVAERSEGQLERAAVYLADLVAGKQEH